MFVVILEEALVIQTIFFRVLINLGITKEYIINCFESKEETMKLQQVILNSDSQFIDSIIYELRNSFNIIMQDKNGNYFCSDLLKKCNDNQRFTIIMEIHKYISKIIVNII